MAWGRETAAPERNVTAGALLPERSGLALLEIPLDDVPAGPEVNVGPLRGLDPTKYLKQLERTEASPTRLVDVYHVEEMVLSEVGPEHVSEHEFRVSGTPKHKVRQSILPPVRMMTSG